jgi:hypothetical protein
MPPARRTHPLVKAAVALVLLAVVAVLFMRSLDDARAEPFTVRADQLAPWTLVADGTAAGERAVVALVPPPELPMRLFRQVFTRAGESLSSPLQPGVALVLADELRGATVSTDDLLALAREAGLDRTRVTPRCMAYRRESLPGATRQVYFVVFDMPEFQIFREALAARLASAGTTGFDAGSLSPVMLLAGQPDVTRWMPIVVDSDRDCMAPIEAE